MVMGSSLGELTLNFNSFFLVFWLGIEYERLGRKP